MERASRDPMTSLTDARALGAPCLCMALWPLLASPRRPHAGGLLSSNRVHAPGSQRAWPDAISNLWRLCGADDTIVRRRDRPSESPHRLCCPSTALMIVSGTVVAIAPNFGQS